MRGGPILKIKSDAGRVEEGVNARLTVSSPPRLSTVRPSTENTKDPVSVPFVCAPSIVIFGRTKLELACHMCRAPSTQARNVLKRVVWEWNVALLTSSDHISVLGVCASVYTRACSSFFGLDHDNGFLFPSVFDVPYPVDNM